MLATKFGEMSLRWRSANATAKARRGRRRGRTDRPVGCGDLVSGQKRLQDSRSNGSCGVGVEVGGMRVTLEIARYLRPHIKHELDDDGTFAMALREGANLEDLIQQLRLPPHLEVVVLVNNVCCMEKTRVLEDGDILEVLPLVSGG